MPNFCRKEDDMLNSLSSWREILVTENYLLQKRFGNKLFRYLHFLLTHPRWRIPWLWDSWLFWREKGFCFGFYQGWEPKNPITVKSLCSSNRVGEESFFLSSFLCSRVLTMHHVAHMFTWVLQKFIILFLWLPSNSWKWYSTSHSYFSSTGFFMHISDSHYHPGCPELSASIEGSWTFFNMCLI